MTVYPQPIQISPILPLFLLGILLYVAPLQTFAQNNLTQGLIPIPFSSNANDSFLSTAIDPSDSSVYAVGYVGSSEAFGNASQTHQGSRDGIVAKYDSQGNLIWYVYIGASDNDHVSDVAVHENGDISITGQIRGNALFTSVVESSERVEHVGGQAHQAFVARYSGGGELMWVESYGGMRNDIGLKLLALGDQTYTVIAFDNDNNDIVIDGSSVPQITNSPTRGLGRSTSYALLSHDNAGNLNWKSYFGSNEDDIDLSIFNILNPRNLMVAGITSQDNRLYVASLYDMVQSLYDADNNHYELAPLGSSSDADIMFMEYNLSGTPQWQTNIWCNGGSDAHYLNLTSDCSGLFISATLDGTEGIEPNSDNQYFTGTGYDPMLFKASLDDGQITWHREFVTDDDDHVNDYIADMSTDGRGHLFLIGGFHQEMAYNQNFAPASQGQISPTDNIDMFAAALNSGNGKVRYMRELGHEGIDYGLGIDAQSGIISMVGSGTAEDEFELPPSSSFNPSFNLAAGIALNTMCSTFTSCGTAASLDAGSISANPSGPYCPNQVIQLVLSGNSQNADWASLGSSGWQNLASNTSSISYTVTENVKMHAIVHDYCGNADTNAFSINVGPIAPTPSCHSTYTVYLDALGSATLLPEEIDNGSSNPCGGALTYSLSQSTFDCSDLNDPSVTLTVINNASESATCNTAIDVQDTIAPSITCPSGGTYNLPAGACQMQITNLAPVSSGDNCSPYSVIYDVAGATTASGSDDASGTFFNDGLSNVTYLIEDDNNNTATCSFGVTVTPNLPTISISDASAVENQSSLDFIVSLSHSSCQATTVTYQTANGSASDGSDYTASGPSFLYIPAGETSAVISVTLNDDLIYEGDEEMTVNLTGSINGSVVDNSAVGTIIENESLPSLSIQTTTVNEGDGTVDLNIEISEVVGFAVQVDLTLLPGTASTLDYTPIASPTTVTIPAGSSGVDVGVSITDDGLFEGTESFAAELSNPINTTLSTDSTATVTIIDNDTAPELSIVDQSVNEGAGTISVQISLSAVSGLDASFDISTSNITTGNDDYEEIPVGTPLTIPAGDSSVTLVLAIDDDIYYEGNEIFGLTLSNPINATLSTDDSAQVTIVDNDAMPALSIDDFSINEADGQVTVVVMLSSAAALDAEFEISLNSGSATVLDYIDPTTTSLTIPAGNTSIDFDITIVDDLLYEGDETFSATLSNPVNATLSSQNVGEITIIDNEVGLTITAWSDFTSECQVDQSQVGCDVSGGCGGYVITRDSSFVADCGTTGTWTYTHTVTDACLISVSDTQVVSTEDTSPPLLSAQPADVTVECLADVPAPVSLAWTDNCDAGGNVTGVDDTQVGDNCSGTITRRWNVTDACGNAAIEVTQTITIDDSTAPVIAPAPADLSVECLADVPAPASLAWNDNCDAGANVTSVDDALMGDKCGGTITRRWNVTDACGNAAAEVTQTITIDDNTAPAIDAAPANVTVECLADVPAPASLAWTDNCDAGGNVTGVDDTQVGDNCSGTITRRWNVTDACGNTAIEVTQTITIEDNTAPVIAVAPADVTVECLADVPPPANLAWTDNCDAGANVTSVDDALMGDNCGGTITRRWNVTDACGNAAAEVTQTITIDDNTPPAISAAASVTIECGEDVPAADADASDSCGDATWTVSEEFLADCGETGVYTRTYTATDDCGNTATATQTVTVVDTTTPTFTINADALVECASEYDVVGSSNWLDCNDMSMQIDTIETTDLDGEYSLEIVYTLSDECGNDSTQTQVITFQDETAPYAFAQNVAIPMNSEGYAVALALNIDNGSFDECSDVTLSIDLDTLYAVGDYPVTLSVMDAAGNTSYDEALVTVIDDIAPEALCQNTTIYLNENGAATLSTSEVDIGSSDNSGTLNLSLSQTEFDCADINNSVQVTLTASDGSLSDECTSFITVLDTISPTIECPSALTFSEPITSGDAYLEIPVPPYTENCAGEILINDYTNTGNASANYPFGETIITWTISNNGQEASCSTTVELAEYIAPEINCLPQVMTIASEDACGSDLILDLPEIAGIETLANDYGDNGATAFFPVGETSVVWYTLDDGLADLQCTTLVTVTDETSPVISCLNDTVHCGLNLSLPMPIVSDNCPTSMSYSINAIDNAPMEFNHETPMDVVWTASDGTNTTECVTSVTAYDNSIPAITGTDQDLNAIYETTIDALTQSVGTGYWTFIEGDGVISDSQSNITTVSQLQSGTNVLLWTVESEVCGKSMDQITLNVRDFLIPTAFSPNGDGFNDAYRIVGINTIPENEFKVYSRWGELVYSASNYSNDWMGQSPMGKLLPPDTYYFILDVKGPNAEAYKGSIEIRY